MEQRKLTTEDEHRHEPHGGLDAHARGEHNHMTLAETGDPVMRHPVEHMVTGALWSTSWRRQKKCISKTLRGEQTTPWSSVVLQLFLKGHYLRVAANNSCNLVTIGTRTHTTSNGWPNQLPVSRGCSDHGELQNDPRTQATPSATSRPLSGFRRATQASLPTCRG